MKLHVIIEEHPELSECPFQDKEWQKRPTGKFDARLWDMLFYHPEIDQIEVHTGFPSTITVTRHE